MKIHEKPLDAPGLISYRAKVRYGWMMIGAKDDADAMSEALRSTDSVKSLWRWNGSEYVELEVS